MAKVEVCDSIRNIIDQLIADPVEKVVRNPDWGTVNFSPIENNLRSVLDMVRPYLTLPIDILPDNIAGQIVDSLNQFLVMFNRMKEFDISQVNSVSIRDEISNQIKGQAEILYQILTPHIPYLAFRKGDVDAYIREASRARDQAVEIVNTTQLDVGQKVHELGEIIKAAREASATVGVAHFTSDFSAAEQENEKSAKLWLWIASGASFVTLAVAIYSYFLISASTNTNLVPELPRLISKIFVLGILVSMTVWCARIYKARKHLAILNRHRADALKTFQAFVKATDNDSVRDAVLLETTRSIFAVGQTGFIDSSDGPSSSDIKIVELIKAVAPKL